MSDLAASLLISMILSLLDNRIIWTYVPLMLWTCYAVNNMWWTFAMLFLHICVHSDYTNCQCWFYVSLELPGYFMLGPVQHSHHICRWKKAMSSNHTWTNVETSSRWYFLNPNGVTWQEAAVHFQHSQEYVRTCDCHFESRFEQKWCLKGGSEMFCNFFLMNLLLILSVKRFMNLNFYQDLSNAILGCN